METTSLPAPASSEGGASPAEELPGLYRAILERVAELEALGERPEAATIRFSATRIYSAAWDGAGRKGLISLLARADRAVAGEARTRTWVVRRRSVPAR